MGCESGRMICGEGALLAFLAFGGRSPLLVRHVDTLPTVVNMELLSGLQQAQLAATCLTHAAMTKSFMYSKTNHQQHNKSINQQQIKNFFQRLQ